MRCKSRTISPPVCRGKGPPAGVLEVEISFPELNPDLQTLFRAEMSDGLYHRKEDPMSVASCQFIILFILFPHTRMQP
jgi:hypothetical protein